MHRSSIAPTLRLRGASTAAAATPAATPRPPINLNLSNRAPSPHRACAAPAPSPPPPAPLPSCTPRCRSNLCRSRTAGKGETRLGRACCAAHSRTGSTRRHSSAAQRKHTRPTTRQPPSPSPHLDDVHHRRRQDVADVRQRALCDEVLCGAGGATTTVDGATCGRLLLPAPPAAIGGTCSRAPLISWAAGQDTKAGPCTQQGGVVAGSGRRRSRQLDTQFTRAVR